jgi:hypothetical protein
MLALVTTDKIPWNNLTIEQQKEYDVFIVNKILSADTEYVELVNIMQMHYNMPKKHSYNVLLRLLPKKKVNIDFIKSSKEKINKDLLLILSKHYRISISEAKLYYNKMGKADITILLNDLGYDNKQINKLMK